MKRLHVCIALAAGCGAALLCAAWLSSEPAEVLPAKAPPVAAPPVAAAPAPAANGSLEFFAPVGGPGKDDKPASLSARIDRLSATGRPEDALLAFELARSCKALHDERRKFGPASPDVQGKICGDITNLQLREMEKNLDKAVAARAPGALFAKLSHGPLGGNHQALIDTPDDPAVVEWKKRIMAEVTEAAWTGGDFLLLASLSGIYEEGQIAEKNLTFALAYKLAMLDIHFSKADTAEKVQATRAKAVSKLSASLTVEQLAEAEALAKKIALSCCSKK